MNLTLMKAIVDLAVFCGVSEDNIVDPDAAVAQLEQLMFTLKQLTSDQIDEFIQYVQHLIVEESTASTNSDRQAFLLSFAENLGLITNGAS